MALYPCTHCGQRIDGDASSVYLQAYQGSRKVAFRHSVHETCVEELVEGWPRRAAHKDARGFWNLPGLTESLDDLWTPSDDAQAVFGRRNGS